MLFPKLRIRKAKEKMEKDAKFLASIYKRLEHKEQDSIEYEALESIRSEAKEHLNHSAWNFCRLDQEFSLTKLPPFPVPDVDWESFHKAKAIFETMRSRKTIDDADNEMQDFEKTLDDVNGFVFIPPKDKDCKIPVIWEKLSLAEDNINSILLRLIRIENRTYLTTDIKGQTTLKDINKLMRDKMAEVDPGLQGNLAMLLHKLRDPANNPISLLGLADQVTSGQCPEAELVASALDMLVDEYRKKIGPKSNFEMSDKACLEALDGERNTIC